MGYFARLVVGCALGLWAAASAVQAGPREDCEQGTDRTLQIKACTEVISRDKKAAWAYVKRGNAYLGDEYITYPDDKDRAIADFDEAIRLNPKDGLAYEGRGIAYFHHYSRYQGVEGDRAIADFSKAINLNPQSGRAFRLRGLVYRVRIIGPNPEAMADFDEAIRLNPKDSLAFSERGCLRAQEYVDLAIADFSEALRLNPIIGQAFQGFDYGPSTHWYRRASDGANHRRAPICGLLDPLHHRGMLFLRKGDYERAIDDLTKAVDRKWSIITLFLANRDLGTAYLSVGKYDKAASAYGEAVKQRTFPASRPGVYGLRGIALAIMGNYDDAIFAFREASMVEGDYQPEHLWPAAAFAYRARAYEAKGDREKAINDYTVAMSKLEHASTKLNIDAKVMAQERLAALKATVPSAPSAVTPSKAPKVVAPPVLSEAEKPPVVVAEPEKKTAPPTPLGRRVALVIGNAAYKVGALVNPGNDARKVAETLRALGFDKVVLERDLATADFRTRLAAFAGVAAGADLAMVYYAGHGVEVGGCNYLLPVDLASATSANIKLQGIELSAVLDQLAGVRKLKLVVLDACRTELLVDRGGSRGPVAVDPAPGTLVVYAAKAGTTADDGGGRPHSPFAEAFLKNIAKAGVEVRQLFGYIGDETLALTGGKQQPFTYSSLGGPPLYLHVRP